MTSYKRISAADAHTLRADNNPTIVDIRDERSYASGHISGARHLDNTTLPAFLDAADPATPLIVCCYHGNMSQSAAAFFVERGFQDVYSLDGGFSAWSMQYPGEVEAGAQ